MKGNVRAKFRCMEVADRKWEGLEPVKFYAVNGNSDSEENKAFWEATPSGDFELDVKNPDSFGLFESGAYYYLDFTLKGNKPTVYPDEPIVTTTWVVINVSKNWESSTGVSMGPHNGTWDAENRKHIPYPGNDVLWPAWATSTFNVSIDHKAPASQMFDVGEAWTISIRKAPAE